MRQVEHERVAHAASSATAGARRLRIVQPAEASPVASEEFDHLEGTLDYDELARALLRHVLRCLRTS
jgi:hypothetical protein